MTTEAIAPPAAPAPVIPTATDRITGETVNVFAGGDPVDNSGVDGDRGDLAVDPAQPAVVEAAPAVPPTVIADAAIVAADHPVEAALPAVAGRAPIPYDRFREVNDAKKAATARADALQLELATLKAGTGAPAAAPDVPAYDYGVQEASYADLLLDGRTKDAAALRTQINAQLLADAAAAARAVSQTTTAQMTSQGQIKSEIDAAANDFSTRYPALDDISPDYNAEAVADIQMYYQGAINRGVGPVQAFKTAVEKAVKLYDMVDSSKPVGGTAVSPAARLDVAAAAALAAAQPPVTGTQGKSGSDGGFGDIDVENLTDAQLAALPPATLARLRGDTV